VKPGTEMTVYLAFPDSGKSRNILIDSVVVRRSAGYSQTSSRTESHLASPAFVEETMGKRRWWYVDR
jgi:hypothetical protein